MLPFFLKESRQANTLQVPQRGPYGEKYPLTGQGPHWQQYSVTRATGPLFIHSCMSAGVSKKELFYIRGQSIKKLNFFLIYCFTYNLIKLVSFKVLSSTLDTPLPTFFPVLERVLERVLRDGAKVPYRIFLYCLKSATF
jgi:hypothetical protein